MSRPPYPPHPHQRPPDNEPAPLLTYDGESEEKTHGDLPRRSTGRWVLTAVIVVASAGLGYWAFQTYWSQRSPELSELTPLTPSMTGSGGDVTGALRAVTPTDTTVAPGSEVEVAVRLSDGSGRPASDMRVHFSIELGSVSQEEEAWTNPSGVARTTVQMPPRPAQAVIRATAPSFATATETFRLSARTGSPAEIVELGGSGQESDAGTLLPERLQVRVTDAAGLPVPGVEIRFDVVSGGGLTAPSRARTDTLGVASAIWRLGFQAGTQTLSASSDELAQAVTFSATARATEATTAPGPGVSPDPEAGIAAPTEGVSVAARPYAVGGGTVCAIRDNAVRCRGANDRGQRLEGELRGSLAVTAGLFHACALDASGVASCWGANDSGQLGDGSTSDRAAPVRVATDDRFSALAAGVAHTCGLGSGGLIHCWGANLGGQLGDGSRNDRALPGAAQGTNDFSRIVAGWNHTCAVTGGGEAFCWGLNREGAVGDGSRLDRLTPTRVLDGVTDLAAGSAHTCAVRQGQVLCWGTNALGQLGDGTAEARTSPTPVSDLPGAATAVAAGAAHTCALLQDGSVHCWGQNLQGQLGDGTHAPSSTPRAVAGDLRFARIHAGGGVTCGITTDGEEYCWGLNQSGELGDGTRTNRSLPTPVTSPG